MSGRDEKKDEMSGRLSERFEDDPDDQDNLNNTDEQSSPDDTDSQDDSDDITPKEDWTGRMVYVPDEQLEAFDGEYDRMQYETDWEIAKQRHYYPVLVRVGIQELEQMGGEEFTDAVDELDLR